MALKNPLTVAWISDFPIEWLSDIPDAVRALPRRHPATWQVVLLAEFEKNPAIRTHVILLRGPIARDISFERNGTVFHVLKAKGKQRLASFFWLDTLLIRRVCRRIQPDLVHAWGSEKGSGLIASRMRWPYVMTIQGLFAWYSQRIKMPVYDRFVEIVERISLKRARVVTTESAFAVRFLAEHFPGPIIHQAEHAPNVTFREVVRRPQTTPIQFLSIGGLGHRKGTDMLFAALDRVRVGMDFQLKVICGPDPTYIELMRASVSAETWNRVEFKHQLEPHEVAAELETPTMLLMPTRADTSPNAVKEAVVAGVPVVAASVGGIPDYVLPEKNGLLFPAGDLDAFIQTIQSACAHPLLGRGQVDPQTLAKERDYLSPELMAKNFVAAYETAISPGPR
jgi:glycosyltransferase involved in cell wall biosynthesis